MCHVDSRSYNFVKIFLWTLLTLKLCSIVDPVLMGENLDNAKSPEICILCTLFWDGPVFKLLFAKLLPHLQLAVTFFYYGQQNRLSHLYHDSFDQNADLLVTHIRVTSKENLAIHLQIIN